jgi:hypothetical protein
MERKIQRRSMRLAKAGPGGVPGRDLALHLMYASAAKPGWKSRNWIMNQEWFDTCQAIRWPTDPDGIFIGIPVTVDDHLGGFPRIERYLRVQQGHQQDTTAQPSGSSFTGS